MMKVIEKITYKDNDTIEKTTRKIEILGKINGPTMLAGVMNLWGWNLVIKDKETNACIIINGKSESDLLDLKHLISKTQIKISIQIPSIPPDAPPDTPPDALPDIPSDTPPEQ